MTTSTAGLTGHDPASTGAGASRRLFSDLVPGAANVMLSWFLGLTWGIVMITLLVTSVAMIPALGIGLLMLWGMLALIRLVLGGERARARAVYGLPVRDLARPRIDPRDGWFRRTFSQFGSEFWKSFLHHCVKMFLGIVAGSAALWFMTVGIGSLGMIGSGAIGYRILPGLEIAPGWAYLAGAVSFVLGLVILWAAVLADRVLDNSLLVGSEEELRREVVELEGARGAAERAAEAERRRLERDLHDGAQPRLVNLAMTLGMAKSKMDTDPEAARQMIDEAHTEAKYAVNDLRQLARGIHPAVLTDRGLDAALSALAARSPVPVRVRVELAERPPRAAESVAYFVVAEALTNVAKHARARRADVVVTREGDILRVVVMDDGVGGARVLTGTGHTGLSGLAERVHSARGHLTLTSPEGGPTILTAEIPCV